MKARILTLATVIMLIASCSESSITGAPPDHRLTANPQVGTVPLQVVFTLEFTENSDYTINSIDWDIDGDGGIDSTMVIQYAAIDSAVSYSVNATYINAGTYSPRVTITYNENDARSFSYLRSKYVEVPGRGNVYSDSIYVLE